MALLYRCQQLAAPVVLAFPKLGTAIQQQLDHLGMTGFGRRPQRIMITKASVCATTEVSLLLATVHIEHRLDDIGVTVGHCE